MTTGKYSLDPSLRAVLVDLGVRPANVLRRAGLRSDLLSKGPVWLEQTEFFALWEAIETETGDPNLPLRIEDIFAPEVFAPPIFAALMSKDLNTAAARVATYKKLIGPMVLMASTSAMLPADSSRILFSGRSDSSRCRIPVATTTRSSGPSLDARDAAASILPSSRMSICPVNAVSLAIRSGSRAKPIRSLTRGSFSSRRSSAPPTPPDAPITAALIGVWKLRLVSVIREVPHVPVRRIPGISLSAE